MAHPPHSGIHRHAEPVSVSPSILRMSVIERLAVVAAVLVILWAAVHGVVSS